MMKTFTVTLHHSNNYGALLQAYALQRTQQNMGIENVIFEYSYPKPAGSSGSWKARLSNAYRYGQYLLHQKEIRRREESFERFHRERLRLSKVYHSVEELRSDRIDADVLITGSDQVWRFSRNQEFIPARFLDFGNDAVRRISYAASIEKLSYTDEQQEQVKTWLSRFQAISLREKSACEYIGKLTGRSAEWVLDPVFLLGREEWDRISTPLKDREPYILCYQVQRCERMQEVVDILRKRMGVKTIAVLPESVRYIRTDVSRFDVSPEEFLGLYKNASAVVTGSFHGTAFGYLFGKPTFSVVRDQGASRITELAERFGTGPFCIGKNSVIPDADAFDSGAVCSIICEEREKSLDFLSKGLFNR